MEWVDAIFASILPNFLDLSAIGIKSTSLSLIKIIGYF